MYNNQLTQKPVTQNDYETLLFSTFEVQFKIYTIIYNLLRLVDFYIYLQFFTTFYNCNSLHFTTNNFFIILDNLQLFTTFYVRILMIARIPYNSSCNYKVLSTKYCLLSLLLLIIVIISLPSDDSSPPLIFQWHKLVETLPLHSKSLYLKPNSTSLDDFSHKLNYFPNYAKLASDFSIIM